MLDCDDDDPMTNGPQTELRDGVDNDCDGAIDETPVESTFFPDTDLDGYGDPSGTTITSHAPVAGYALLPIDCDDSDPARSPKATEVCNGVDDDCNGSADFAIGVNDWGDDDGDGRPDAACAGSAVHADCDDTDPITYSGAAERRDHRDNDCDGVVDESCGGSPDVDGGMDVGPDAGPSCAPVQHLPSSGTGTVNRDDASVFIPQEGIATWTTAAGESGLTGTLEIAFANHANLCGYQRANQQVGRLASGDRPPDRPEQHGRWTGAAWAWHLRLRGARQRRRRR